MNFQTLCPFLHSCIYHLCHLGHLHNHHQLHHDHVDQDLLRGIDDPGVVTKLEHTKHRGEYAVRQKESQALDTPWIKQVMMNY